MHKEQDIQRLVTPTSRVKNRRQQFGYLKLGPVNREEDSRKKGIEWCQKGEDLQGKDTKTQSEN